MHTSPSPFWPKAVPMVGLFGGIAMAACQWLVFIYAPVEATLGLSQKIFYLHLPLAWWGLFSFFIVFVAGAAYLVTRIMFWDALAAAAASVGLLLAILALVSGMFWGRHAWGIWWTWDARLTTTLIMCFVYAGYMLLRQIDMPPARRATVAAVVGIVAFLDVPLVYFSARLWSYLHPPSIGLEPAMKLTVIASVVCFGFIWIALVSLRCREYLLQERVNSLLTEQILRQE